MLSTYSSSIVDALIAFPFVAFIFTIPYMIYCYRKYGSLIGLRILIVYSFILYLMCAYFLVILPLPDPDKVAKLTTPRAQLIPFTFIFDILKESKKYSLLANRALIQAVFNIVLTIPFGMYLRYYFNTSFKKTLISSFLLSLFFELTQLSGLYFIYVRGYRLFDVDDLFLNTLGGVVGYFLVYPFTKVLPTRNKLDEISLEKGKNVSIIRRLFLIFIDIVVISIIFSIIDFIFLKFNIEIDIPYTLVAIIYLISSCLIFKGRSIGMIATRTNLSRNDNKPLKFYNVILRYLIMFGVYAYLPFSVLSIFTILNKNGIIQKEILYICDAFTIFYLLFIYLYTFIEIIKKKNLLYEGLSKTKISSDF